MWSERSDSPLFNQLRLDGLLCDVLLKVEDREFRAHRLILSSCSSYLSDVFCNKEPEVRVFMFPNVSAQIMSLILDYAYTLSLLVTEEVVVELLEAAHSFGISDIKDICSNFLKQKLSPKNCIGIWKLARRHQCPSLSMKAYLYMLLHFEEVAQVSREFLELDKKHLLDLISNRELNIRQESAVFEAVVRWIEHKPEEREGHIVTLLHKVCFPLMPHDYLVFKVRTHPLVMRNSECVQNFQKRRMERIPAVTRLPATVLLAVGGQQDQCTTNAIELYNVRSREWVTVDNTLRHIAYHATAVLDGFVYVIGGFDEGDYLSSVYRLNSVDHVWQEVGSMHMPRGYTSVVALDGCIYAMGGCDGRQRLKSAEQFMPDTNQWTMIAPMLMQRSDTMAAALNGKVYICGGFDGVSPLESAECYSPHTEQWTAIAPMSSGRNGVGVVAYEGHILVIGGYDGSQRVSSVTAYNPQSDSWQILKNMTSSRGYFGTAVLEDQVYVVGGNQNTFNTVECYDWKTNIWSIVPSNPTQRRGLSCCIVDRLPFAASLLQ